MEQKDPKDMTASELLRATADSIREGVSSRGVRFSSADSIDEFREMLDVDSEPTYAEDMTSTLSVLADKIDAELSDARAEGIEASLRAGAEIWAKANGWPDFKEGEDFGAWLERCAYKKPVDDCNEPVQIGDKVIHQTTCETCTVYCINTFDDSICIGFLGSHPAVDLRDGDRLKRPAPEVLGADGKPIKVGETVYPIDDEWIGIPLEVSGIESPASVKVYLSAGKSWTTFHADSLTHTPPDTQERIDADAQKDHIEYWQCSDIECGECPSKIDDMTPQERYECNGCDSAMTIDLLRRQRELDARKGGVE